MGILIYFINYISFIVKEGTSQVILVVKKPAHQCRKCKRHRFDPWVRKIPLEKEMATHSSILAWRIPWTEEVGGLWSTGLQRVGHD